MWQQRTYALEAELHEAQVEIVKLREGLDSYHEELAPLRADNRKLRKALKKIKECRIVDSNGNEVAEDSAYYMRSYARAALQKDEEG
jgi:regulator of replication initiation timing